MSDPASRVAKERLALPSPHQNFRDDSEKFRGLLPGHVNSSASFVPRDLSSPRGQERFWFDQTDVFPTPNVQITFAFVALFDDAPELKQKTKERQSMGREALERKQTRREGSPGKFGAWPLTNRMLLLWTPFLSERSLPPAPSSCGESFPCLSRSQAVAGMGN